MGDEEPGQYSVFGSILIPALTAAMENGDLEMILPICAFLEDVSTAARHDGVLETLLKVEVAEWLGWAANEERLAPWLGTETKRICNYVPGLAPNDSSYGLKRKPTRSLLGSLQQSKVSTQGKLKIPAKSGYRQVHPVGSVRHLN
ncbi:hypothetical protein [Tunturiibacter gelidoferens]|uniref:Uncharacterized protein n=2 Tax=Tunturiibacter TaxID=3154218 RepID=A0A7Y9NRE2_9BACT|nr:hypothetical protein [Edaphobacter lichenicola]MBB5341532.1 hypothetical protein [Edaphobacter lichenicola]NYF53495.1 hypothetical protein [Edaphobacter lichenicola]